VGHEADNELDDGVCSGEIGAERACEGFADVPVEDFIAREVVEEVNFADDGCADLIWSVQNWVVKS